MDTALPAPLTLHAAPAHAWLLGHDAARRRTLTRMLLADGLFLVADVLRTLAVAQAGATLTAPLALLGLDLACMVAFFMAVRSGLTESTSDPALTLPQVLAALVSIVLSFWCVEAARGLAWPLLCVVAVMGIHRLTPLHLLGVMGAGLGLLAAMAALAHLIGEDVQPDAVMATLAAAVFVAAPACWLAARHLGHLHQQARAQRHALADAVTRLEALSTRDSLTGLTNHRHMLTLLDAECKRHSRGGRAFCLALIDLDQFQRVNEEQGRERGDDILKRLAMLSQGHLRASDVMARWGGEEFLVLMPETDLPGSLRSLERWREHLATRLGFYREGRWVPVTCSAGLTAYRSAEPLHLALARAEQALQSAKAQGRDKVVAA